jgi:hypothetical protein
MNAGRKKQKNYTKLLIAAVCAAITLGGAAAAYAAAEPETEYTDITVTATEPGSATIAVEGKLIPTEKGEDTTGTSPGGETGSGETTPTDPIGNKTPDGSKPASKSPSGEKNSVDKQPAATNPAAVASTAEPDSGATDVPLSSMNYPDGGTSSIPGEVTVVKLGRNAGLRAGGVEAPIGKLIYEEQTPKSSVSRITEALASLKQDSWSIENAVFALISLIATFACAVLSLTGRRVYRRVVRKAARDILLSTVPQSITPDTIGSGAGHTRNGLWLALCLIITGVSIALFVLTQDVSRTMELTDKWTAAFGAAAVASVIAARLASERKVAQKA